MVLLAPLCERAAIPCETRRARHGRPKKSFWVYGKGGVIASARGIAASMPRSDRLHLCNQLPKVVGFEAWNPDSSLRRLFRFQHFSQQSLEVRTTTHFFCASDPATLTI